MNDQVFDRPSRSPSEIVSGDDLGGIPAKGESLEDLRLSVDNMSGLLEEVQKTILHNATSLSKAAQEWDLQTVETKFALLQNAVDRWQREWAAWGKMKDEVCAHLIEEVEMRLDLQPSGPAADLLAEEGVADLQPAQVVAGVMSLLDQILEYDKEKRDALTQLDQIRSSIVSLRHDISSWTQEDPEITVGPDVERDEARLALGEVREAIEQAISEEQELESRCIQLRELGLSRIAESVARLREYNVSDDTSVAHDLTLGDLMTASISQLPPGQLVEIEQMVEMLLNEQIVKARASAPTRLAASLHEEWNDDRLIDLLGCLAKEKRDVETLLMMLTANAAHPRLQLIALSRPVVGSLFRGVEQLAKAHPFGLLNVLAPDLINGWKPDDPESQAELCIVMLAAQYGGGWHLPPGFLWQLSIDWPVEGMPNWETVWQAALQEEPLPITSDSGDQDWAERLDETRNHARQMFNREHGFFVRLNSLRSRRHQTMMNSAIMPDLLSMFEFLESLERKLQTTDGDRAASALVELQNTLTGERGAAESSSAQRRAYEIILSEDELFDRYETCILEAGVDDSDTFHRRTALRTLQECGEGILEYGRSLLGYWRVQLRPEAQVTPGTLKDELARLRDMTPLGQTALKEIIQHADSDLAEWDEAATRSRSSYFVVRELLSQGTYALRLPRLVAHLTGRRLRWSELSHALLNDLALPAEPSEAALVLLEKDAPNQALLIAQYLPLDLQKAAQALKRECEREFENQEMELLRIGGDTADLIEDRELGRWQLLRWELGERLTELQMVREEDEQRLNQQEFELRRRINEADEAIFGIRRTMPAEAYRLVQEGLGLARTAITNEVLHKPVDAYLQEVSYRLEHHSWPLTELQKMNILLEGALAGESPVSSEDLTAERVLELLQHEELRQLGLSPNDIVPSEAATRSDLLGNWLAVREFRGFLSEELAASERMTIQRLFSAFTQMVAMRYSRNPQGKPLAFDRPAIYSYWELQYPKTTPLQEKCILLVLPGQPPSAKNISELHRLMSEKEWLDYSFVFLFIPGCTPNVRQRLMSSYRNRGLLIIDEEALLDIVLAEKRSTNPIGRLRPMMLNACAAEDVSVFEINHVVNVHNAIFVGRDALVQRISSSGANYALYGGRRIGKSSVLMAIADRLKRRGMKVVSQSFDGWDDCSDNACAGHLAKEIGLEDEIAQIGDLRLAIQEQLDNDPSLSMIFLLDEIDRYIRENPSRHVLIEALRALSDRYRDRFRVVLAGFMDLYDCLHDRGPYSPASDPWSRMLNDIGPVENLRPSSAEQIAKEGFLAILGWEFETRAISQRIVERTGGHPAFVQCFCKKLQERVGLRGDRYIRLEDVEAVFDDEDPEQSFIAYVRKTLKMNLEDPIARYLIPWLAVESSEAQGFTLDQTLELAQTTDPPIPEGRLKRSLERLVVTSVVKERAAGVYEFSVPDYPSILRRLGHTDDLNLLEKELETYLKSGGGGVRK